MDVITYKAKIRAILSGVYSIIKKGNQ